MGIDCGVNIILTDKNGEKTKEYLDCYKMSENKVDIYIGETDRKLHIHFSTENDDSSCSSCDMELPGESFSSDEESTGSSLEEKIEEVDQNSTKPSEKFEVYDNNKRKKRENDDDLLIKKKRE